MKKFIGIAKGLFKKGEIIKNTVDGIEKIGKVKVSKKKIALGVIIVLAILVLLGVISEETFIELFKIINQDFPAYSQAYVCFVLGGGCYPPFFCSKNKY